MVWRKYRFGLIATGLHVCVTLVFHLGYSYHFNFIDLSKFEAFGYITLPGFLYELPFITLCSILGLSNNITSAGFVMYTYTFGSLFYFILGMVVGFLFSSEKDDKKV